MQPLTPISRFSILKLPYVAFKNLIANFELSDLIVLSSQSKRTKLLIRSSFPRNKFKLYCLFEMFPRIFLVCGEQHLTKEFDLHDDRSLQNPDGTCSLPPFSDEFIEKMKAYTDFLCEIFNCIIHDLHIESNYCLGRFKSIYDWVNLKQSSIENCSLDGYEGLNGEITDFIQNCKVTRLFFFRGITRTLGPIHPKFVSDLVHLGGCGQIPFVTLDDVSQFDCIEIIMGDFRVFSSTNINNFLKNWIRRPSSRMKCFVVYVPCLEPEALFEGIQVEKREESLVRCYESQYFGTFKLEGGYDFESENGKSATVHQVSKYFVDKEGQIHAREVCQFTMIVWN